MATRSALAWALSGTSAMFSCAPPPPFCRSCCLLRENFLQFSYMHIGLMQYIILQLTARLCNTSGECCSCGAQLVLVHVRLYSLGLLELGGTVPTLILKSYKSYQMTLRNRTGMTHAGSNVSIYQFISFRTDRYILSKWLHT